MTGLQIVTGIAEGGCDSTEMSRTYQQIESMADWLCGNNGILCPPLEPPVAFTEAEFLQLKSTVDEFNQTIQAMRLACSADQSSVCGADTIWNVSQQQCVLHCEQEAALHSFPNRSILFGRLLSCRDNYCHPTSMPPSMLPSVPPSMPPSMPPS
eukprot:CAMPEP_0119306278 /NCGR_PEP_ID=MMETSP1333-20130426/7070_1 /TAXON_ID=418940 /ORGANISM="Scyphosphaera apsteinii, Strain RCC1455" /LENGTH=153 /DNA_ID=CAMNT_0007309535 /DNA_START=192 /DNA_END=649 /DNA_ORIENTATION=+